MDRPDGEDNFAALLQSLRVRCGRSYEDLARSTFTSRSTLHRYCTGAGLPVEDEVVTRLGAACGADPDELSELTRRWKAALAERDQVPDRTAAAVLTAPDAAPDAGTADPGPPPGGLHPATTTTRPRRRVRLAAAGVAVLLVAGAAGGLLRGGGGDDPAQARAAAADDVCATRADVTRADGPSGAFDARWTGEQLCPNRPNTPVFLTPLASEDDTGAQAGTLYSTESWFVCWTVGRMHAGGNRIWYYTQGDVSHPEHRERRAWGFVPARYLDTVVDPDPGTPQCPPLQAD